MSQMGMSIIYGNMNLLKKHKSEIKKYLKWQCALISCIEKAKISSKNTVI